MKRRKVIHFRRKLRVMRRLADQDERFKPALEDSVRGWANHVRYADTWGLRKAIIGTPFYL